MDKTLLRDAQLRMLSILKDIHDICVKYDIKYFLVHGTLLGAVRHRGFIPWDDDCDIAMMRDDYEKFADIAARELPAHLFLQNRKTDRYYDKRVVKVRDGNSLIVETEENDEERYNQGLYVDIFVYDYYEHGELIYKFMEWGGKIKSLRKRYPKGSFKRTVAGFLVNIPYGFHRMLRELLILTSRVWRKNKKLKYVGKEIDLLNTYKYSGYLQEEVFPLSKLNFEGFEFYVPKNPDYFLKTKYGDYMTIPPEGQRKTHARAIRLL